MAIPRKRGAMQRFPRCLRNKWAGRFYKPRLTIRLGPKRLRMQSTPPLTADELRHYHRQLALPEIGLRGQEILGNASVLIVGAGGLGSPLALYLAAAGIGRLGLVDADVVEVTNLHRQVLHTMHDLGRHKVEAAREKLRARNPHITIESHRVHLTSENALDLIRGYDIVADGTDNFPARYLISDACVLTQTPNVYGSVYQFEGQVSVFSAPQGPCYRCLYPMPPPPNLVPSCAEGGVLGLLPGIVGCLQGAEATKLLLGIGEPLVGRMLLVDVLNATFKTLTVRPSPSCAACGDSPSITRLIDYGAFCGLENKAADVPEIDARSVHALRQGAGPPLMLDVRQQFESEIATLGADLLIPLPELRLRLSELSPYRDRLIVVHCRSGVRSRQAVRILLDAGFAQATSLAGGILAWRAAVDGAIRAY